MVIVAVFSSFFTSFTSPADELIKTSSSPDNAYIIRVYSGDGNGGATVANHIRCNLEDVKEHSFRDIYYQYRQDDAQIKWIDNHTVDISGKVLDVRKDSYDSRDNPEEYEYWKEYLDDRDN